MRILRHIKLKYSSLLLMLCLCCVSGCQDTIDINGVVEGEPATVTLRIELGEMAHLSRANDINASLENRVNDLWIGVYRVSDGARTGTYFIDNIGKDLPESFLSEKVTLNASSGQSYIVAVANSANAQGCTLDHPDTKVNLHALLEAADTWDEYRAIMLRHNFGDNASVDAPSNEVSEGIVMQGAYHSKSYTPVHPQDNNEAEPITINSGTNYLTGKIHLRRLWTQNTVNFEAEGDVISMEIIEMQVINVPEFTWLQGRSRDTDAGNLGYANAGDAVSPEPAISHPYYKNSSKIYRPSLDVSTDPNGKNKYSYSFWQYENKRTGSATKYEEREAEVKDNDRNTGIYTALCPGNVLSLENNATYIRFRASITYKVMPSNTTGLDQDFSDIKTRTAEGTYVVHLGYIDNVATDFNCFRNSKYVYNIKVQSVDKILLEAFRVGETQPGAEGEINDVTDKFYRLDCHYNVFNIYLTSAELDNFTFNMRTYDNNVVHEIRYLKKGDVIEQNVPESKNDPNWKYYSWIKLVPNDGITSGDDTKIAPFPELNEDGSLKNPTDELYYLKDIVEQGSRRLVKEGKPGRGFTVYVKEYTYEADYGEAGYGNESGNGWVRYVNQPDRSAHFNVSFSESLDKESIYYRSKYALSQKSIQTYYDITEVGASGKDATALGVEHDNEVFGMNLRWKDAVSGLSADNGRYNVYLGYGGNSGVAWSNVMDLSSLQSINEIDNTKQTNLAYHISTEARILPVPKTVQIDRNSLTGGSGLYNGKADNDRDPQSDNVPSQYIYVLNACMNRNRDENGNGKIDNAELKWYVPATGKYLRIIMGRNSLVTPLMNYEQVTLPAGCGNDDNTLYHFAASDNKIIWVDEGASSSVFHGGGIYSHAPWQVRCIRNLGTDLNSIINGERVMPAYVDTDKDKNAKGESVFPYGGVVKVTRFHDAALRNPQTAPLPMHKTDSPYNRIGQYGFEYAPRGNTFGGTTSTTEAKSDYNSPGNSAAYSSLATAVSNATFCSELNKNSKRRGWRVPNQKEIIIMMRAGVLGYSGETRYLSCTQEHWANFDTPGSSALPLDWQYRITSVEAKNKIATAFGGGREMYVRCVRDLTAAEASMSYSQIKSYVQP